MFHFYELSIAAWFRTRNSIKLHNQIQFTSFFVFFLEEPLFGEGFFAKEILATRNLIGSSLFCELELNLADSSAEIKARTRGNCISVFCVFYENERWRLRNRAYHKMALESRGADFYQNTKIKHAPGL